MFGEKQYFPSSFSAAGAAPATMPPVSGVILIEERNPIGKRNVLAEHHAMHFVVRADDLAVAINEHRRVELLHSRFATGGRSTKAIRSVDSYQDRRAQSAHQRGQFLRRIRGEVLWRVHRVCRQR